MPPGNLWSICIDELTLTTPKTLNFHLCLCIHILLTVGGIVEQQGCPDLIAAGTFLVLCFHK